MAALVPPTRSSAVSGVARSASNPASRQPRTDLTKLDSCIYCNVLNNWLTPQNTGRRAGNLPACVSYLLKAVRLAIRIEHKKAPRYGGTSLGVCGQRLFHCCPPTNHFQRVLFHNPSGRPRPNASMFRARFVAIRYTGLGLSSLIRAHRLPFSARHLRFGSFKVRTSTI